jgi:hypothetical protein
MKRTRRATKTLGCGQPHIGWAGQTSRSRLRTLALLALISGCSAKAQPVPLALERAQRTAEQSLTDRLEVPPHPQLGIATLAGARVDPVTGCIVYIPELPDPVEPFTTTPETCTRAAFQVLSKQDKFVARIEVARAKEQGEWKGAAFGKIAIVEAFFRRIAQLQDPKATFYLLRAATLRVTLLGVQSGSPDLKVYVVRDDARFGLSIEDSPRSWQETLLLLFDIRSKELLDRDDIDPDLRQRLVEQRRKLDLDAREQ